MSDPLDLGRVRPSATLCNTSLARRLDPPSRTPFIIATIVTLPALAICVYLLFLHPDTTTLGDIGTLLGGFSSLIAFFWLVTGYFAQYQLLRYQAYELARQLEEFSYQRHAIEQSAQAQELASFIELHNFVLSFTSADLHDILYQLSSALPGIDLEALERRFADGQRDAYIRPFLDTPDALNALSTAIRTRSSVTIVDAVRAYNDKYAMLETHLNRLSIASSVKRILLDTSPSAQLFNSFRSLV